MAKITRRPRSFLFAWLLVAVLAGAVSMAPYAIDAPIARTNAFTLCAKVYQANCVIDGDTIRYSGEKIRIMDIDAPEIHEPKCASEKARGERATLRLLEILNAGPITVVRVGSRDRDKYGRQLRVIQRDGRSITEALVAEGLARRWDGRRRSWCG